MTTDRNELEIRIAYQDDTIEQLSRRMFDQSREIARLAERCRALEQRIERMTEGAPDTPERPPPHY